MATNRVPTVFLVTIFAIAILLATAPGSVQAGASGDAHSGVDQQQPNACLAIIQSALSRVYDSCNSLTRNSACYGHHDIAAELNTPLDFK